MGWSEQKENRSTLRWAHMGSNACVKIILFVFSSRQIASLFKWWGYDALSSIFKKMHIIINVFNEAGMDGL
jgi:hypothetical protein